MAQGGYGASLGWSVGRFEWLNSPNSKVNRYWRVIEEGSNATDWPWQGQRIVGLWGPNAGPRGALIQGDLSRFSKSRNDQKFVPFFRSRTGDMEGAARAALYYYLGGGTGKNMELLRGDPGRGSGNGGKDVDNARRRLYFWFMMVGSGRPGSPRMDQLPFVQGIIVREVLAGNYYARALMNFQPMQREIDGIKEIFGADLSSSSGMKETRRLQAADSYDRHTSEVKPKTGRAKAERTQLSTLHSGRYQVTVNASVRVQDQIRNSRGRFTSSQGAIAELNRRLATAFQDEVVQLMRQERRRPVSGALIRATADPQNRSIR